MQFGIKFVLLLHLSQHFNHFFNVKSLSSILYHLRQFEFYCFLNFFIETL